MIQKTGRTEKNHKKNQNCVLQAYANALLVIPKTLATNGGFDAQEAIVKLVEERSASGLAVGLDINTGEPAPPTVRLLFFFSFLAPK